ncbi:uncharacterized protein LOC127723754 [Mytilus californianus]|uniref:uncharacterized protein LOC127723754 n=1 Tax=Mytilus californianus TaxID=6549 RepID=UPI00224650B2|nr:uncharacterized protein LOC127723754 [Mytilus californianus]
MNPLLKQKRQRVPYGDVWDKPFIYLGVTYCNANLNKSFSKNVILALDILSEKLQDNLYVGDSLCDIYQGTSAVLMNANGDVKSIVDVRQRKAVESLVEFVKNLDDGRKHAQCLLEMVNKKDEATIQAVLACHLFSPLLSEGKVFVDRTNRNPRKNSSDTFPTVGTSTDPNDDPLKVECPFCKKANIKADNTNFGCVDMWHGRADIVVKGDNGSMQEIIKIAVDEHDDEEGQGEPASKRAKMDEDIDLWYSLAEVKTDIEGSVTSDLRETQDYVQAISQTILNSFLAVKLNKGLRSHLIPSFFVSPKYIYINFYNVEKDILLVQDHPIKIFDKDGVNYWAILSVWMALNFEKFPCEFQGDASKKSGFQNWLQKHGVLEKYKNEITCKYTAARKPAQEKTNSTVNPMRVAELFRKLIQGENDGTT